MASGAVAGGGLIQGATLGGLAAGPKGALIGGIVGLAAGLFSTDPSKAQLKALEQYNAEVARNTAQSLFDREREQQVSRMRTARALQSYQAQGKTQQGTIKANYGAADLVGGSAVALAQALDFQSKQAESATLFNSGVDFANYITAINQIGQQGVNSLQRSINSAPQQGLNVGALYQAGKSAFEGLQQFGNQGGFSAGLQFGSTPQSAQPQTSNYALPSNLNLSFKGF